MKNFSLFLLIILFFFCSCKKNVISKNNFFYEKAKNFRKANIIDSAFNYYNLAKNDYLKSNDSLGAAKSLVNMAIIQAGRGDFYGSIETSLEANNLLKNEKDSTIRSTLAANYNNMAISSSYLKNYDQSVEFYKKTLEYANDSENKSVYYNNISDVLILQGKLQSAKVYLKKAILAKDSNNYSMALNNLAKVKFLENKNFNPLPEFHKALTIRKIKKDINGENSSYATLSDYYAEKDKEKSLYFANQLLSTATEIKSLSDQAEALQRLIVLDPKNYLINFKKFNEIHDSLQIERNNAKNQFALIRFDVEKIKKENEKKENELLKRNIGLSGLSLLLIGAFFWNKKRQKILKQEKELEVKNTQLKMSKKVHDVVANGIYQVMTKIENQVDFDRDKALDELEFVYEKSRDISYDKIGEEKEFSKVISELIASFNNNTVKTFTAGNSPTIWESVSPTVKEEVYQMVRELMVNMKKHSNASHVALKFEKINNIVEIQYKDNGIGISGDLIYKNGLRNTASRIEAINGTITFDTKIEKGLKVNLSFPVS